MRWMTMMLLAAFALLAPAAPAAAQLAGSYQMAEVGGRPVPTESPDEDGVTVHSGALTLDADGRFGLELEATVRDEGLLTRKVVGSYEVEGDQLFLEPDAGQEATSIQFTFALQDDRLILEDEDGLVITFARR